MDIDEQRGELIDQVRPGQDVVAVAQALEQWGSDELLGDTESPIPVADSFLSVRLEERFASVWLDPDASPTLDVTQFRVGLLNAPHGVEADRLLVFVAAAACSAADDVADDVIAVAAEAPPYEYGEPPTSIARAREHMQWTVRQSLAAALTLDIACRALPAS